MRIVSKYKNMPLPVRATLWFTMCAFLQKAFSMITIPIFTRIMSTEQYGEFSVFTSLMGIIVALATLKIDSIIATRGISKYKGNEDEFLANLQMISVCSVFIFAIIYLLLRKPINEVSGLNTIEFICMTGAMLVLPAYEIWSAKERYLFEYRRIVAVTVVYLCSNTIIGVGAVLLSKEKGQARIVSYCLVQFVLYFIFLIRNLKGYHFNSLMVKYAFAFNLPLIIQAISNQILNKSDVLMIRYYLGESNTGIYSLGYSLAIAITMVTTSINNTFVPWLYNELDHQGYEMIRKVSKLLLMIVYLGVAVIMLLAPEFITIMAPKTYESAAYVVAPAVVGIGMLFLYTFFVQIEMYYDKTITIMIGSMGVAALNIFLNVIFIPRYGAVAAAYTTLASYASYAVVHYFLARSICKDIVNMNQLYDIKYFLVLSLSLVVLMFIVIGLFDYFALRIILAAILLLGSLFLYKKYEVLLK